MKQIKTLFSGPIIEIFISKLNVIIIVMENTYDNLHYKMPFTFFDQNINAQTITAILSALCHALIDLTSHDENMAKLEHC